MTVRSRREALSGALAGAATLGLAGLAGCSSDTDPAAASAEAANTTTTEPTTSAATAPSTTAAGSVTTSPMPAPVVSSGRTKIMVLGSQGGQQITQLTGAGVRCGSSLLVDVDGELTVIDCGCGSVHRLAEAGYDANAVRRILLTHCHADHVAELGSLASFAWSSGRATGDPNRRLDIFGPTGIRDYEQGTKLAFRRSIEDQEGPLAQRPRFDVFATWNEFEPPERATTIVDTDEMEVRTIRVSHGSIPAVGYRIVTPDLDIAISGDRGAEGDDFADFAADVDVLFHEVIHRELVESNLSAQNMAPSFLEHLFEDHTDVADVGRLATQLGVPTVVLYHLIPGNPGVTDEAWAALVEPHYAGRIIVARDLLVV